LPLIFAQNQGQTDLRMSFFYDYPGFYRLPTNANAAPYPGTRMGELWGRKKHFIGGTPKWPKFAPSYDEVPHETTYRVEDLEHYVHNIPLAGPMILRIFQLANAHPHVMRVLMIVKPEFWLFGEKYLVIKFFVRLTACLVLTGALPVTSIAQDTLPATSDPSAQTQPQGSVSGLPLANS
jgi:hypothetical protein